MSIKVPVVWYGGLRGSWCQVMVEEVLLRECTHYMGIELLPKEETGAIVVIKADAVKDMDKFNLEMDRLDWMILIVTSNEEGTFQCDLVRHPRRRIWLQTPHKHQEADFYLPWGFTNNTRPMLRAAKSIEKNLDWSFAGQITHFRREELVRAVESEPERYGERWVLRASNGFTLGLSQGEYYELMVRSRVVPCPSGPCTVDTFRVCEALEAGAVPVVDWRTPLDGDPGYWRKIFGSGHLLWGIWDWGDFGTILRAELDDWPHTANRVFSWWQNYLRGLRDAMEQCLLETCGMVTIQPVAKCPVDRERELYMRPQMIPVCSGVPLTVLIPTSPIPCHPETDLIEATIESIRRHLPDVEIIILCDGVRPEMSNRREQYGEYVRRLLWLCHHKWHNVLPIVFVEHSQQAIMVRHVLPIVKTPLVFFCEHDATIDDKPIDWKAITDTLLCGEANTVRLYWHHELHPEHAHLMKESVTCHGAPFAKTVQWSSWPHVSRIDFLESRLENHFQPDQKSMIETVLYSPCVESTWETFRTMIYCPEGDFIRFHHKDGRTDPKTGIRDPGDW